ncbi:hypothetical protein H5P28_15490, partial [Ruficoccus amylovorans]
MTRCSLFSIILALLSLPAWADSGAASYPQWWLSRAVVDSQPPDPSDPAYPAWLDANYAPANLGQAKHLAKAAYLEMESQETGSAGSEVASMVANFSTNPGINYAPLNLGQLKALAKPFYDVMHAADGFIIVLSDGTSLSSGEYPWDPATPLSANYAPANLGQLKYVFSFSLEEWGVEVTPPEVPGEYERAFVYLVEPTIRYAVVGQAIGLKAVASFPG